MTGAAVAFALVVFVLAGGAFVLDRVALHMIRPPYKPLRKRAPDLPFPSEEVALRSGGQTLSAWILRPLEEARGPVLVMVHGWGSNHGTMARLAGPLLSLDYPVLLFDVRHHGESRGASYVTARHFRDDILAAVEKAKERFPGCPVVLVGHSMGGSTGILAAADGAQIQGLVSIGAPADLWEVWAFHLNRRGIPGRWAVQCLRPFWKYRAGEDWDTLDPLKRGRDVQVPWLIIHGQEDESVSVKQAHLLAGVAGVEPRILIGQGHTDLLESPDLLALLDEFFQAVSSA